MQLQIKLLSELRGFKFLPTLVLVFQKMTLFIQTQKQKKSSMTVTLMMYLKQSILRLNQTYKYI